VLAAAVGGSGRERGCRDLPDPGRRIGSAALIAEGQHARTDALTSLAVVIGVVGAWTGLPQLDALVVGLLIAGVILAVLVRSMRTVVRRLMDGIDDGTLEGGSTRLASEPVASRGTPTRDATKASHRHQGQPSPPTPVMPGRRGSAQGRGVPGGPIEGPPAPTPERPCEDGPGPAVGARVNVRRGELPRTPLEKSLDGHAVRGRRG
jgi:hypothetical protein